MFVAEPGVHCHHLSWSPDGRFLYFATGLPPDEMDVWRVPSGGGTAERITRHNRASRIRLLLDDRTLLYTATADDGTGPWLYIMDLRTERRSARAPESSTISPSPRAPRRAGGVRRLVATVSNPVAQLWTVPIVGARRG